MTTLDVKPDFLQEFEYGLDPQHPERSKIPASILGYGEISTVLEIRAGGLSGIAFKRLPLFNSMQEVDQYRAIFEEYNRLLEQDVGIRLPPHGYAVLRNAAGRPIFYIIQRQLLSASIGNRALHLLPRDELIVFVKHILRELRKVWAFSQRQSRVRLAIDGQISNWAIEGFDPEHPRVDETTRLVYLDTSTPLMRVDGAEQLDTELFLRSAPSFLVWILRLLFLKDVVNRYYDFHLVAVDLAANFYKEQRPDLIPDVIGAINAFFATEAADLGVQPLGEKQVQAYYREDAMIWSLYLAMRRLDRFIRTRLLRREYPYILPGHIQR